MERMKSYGRWLAVVGTPLAMPALTAAPKVRYGGCGRGRCGP